MECDSRAEGSRNTHKGHQEPYAGEYGIRCHIQKSVLVLADSRTSRQFQFPTTDCCRSDFAALFNSTKRGKKGSMLRCVAEALG